MKAIIQHWLSEGNKFYRKTKTKDMLEASVMAERGKGKKCSDCANWKVKDSQCTY
jgi:hypothetical protein